MNQRSHCLIALWSWATVASARVPSGDDGRKRLLRAMLSPPLDERPDGATLPAQDGPPEPALSVTDIMRNRNFWIVGLSIVLVSSALLALGLLLIRRIVEVEA